MMARLRFPLSQRSVGPCRGESHPDQPDFLTVTGQGAPRRTVWQRLKAFNAWIEDCWIGDVIGLGAIVALTLCTPVFLEIMTILMGGRP